MRVICSCADNKIFFLEHLFPIIYMLVGLDNFTFIMGSPLPVSFGQSPEVSSLILISQTAPGRIRLPRVCFYMREHLITMSVQNFFYYYARCVLYSLYMYIYKCVMHEFLNPFFAAICVNKKGKTCLPD